MLQAADWWSVGVTIYGMATGTKPFQNLDDKKRRLEE
jgi:serine/threonine protein kinase